MNNNILFSCFLLSFTTIFIYNNAIADNGESIKKKYHITNPVDQDVDVNVDLSEASALALSHKYKSLWTVSDNKENLVFKMTLDGGAKGPESFEIVNFPYDRPDLEGVCLSGDGQYMYLVQERELAIIKVLITKESTHAEMVDNVLLSSMENYSLVAPYIGGDDNAGLEGITFHTGTNDIYVLVEKVQMDNKKGPLLIRINNALTKILEVKFLNGDIGFVGVDGDTTIDGSGIDFDRTDTSKNRFYIVSDEGQRIFYYDWDKNTAKSIKNLNYSHGEGIAYDQDSKLLYVVTDGGNSDDSKLYIYHDK